MGWIDRVPGLNLFIGGLYALGRRDEVKAANITHVLSVINLPLDSELFENLKHLSIEAEDVEDENLLKHFPATNKFIQDGLDSDGGVYVHCAMGKSRSATCVIAYLMHKFRITPEEALRRLQEGRGVCDPNDGFHEQLRLYHKMGTPDDVEGHPMYQRWLYERSLAASRACGLAPGADEIRFEDEHVTEDSGKVDFEIKCRKCRRILATSIYLIDHVPKRLRDMSKSKSSASIPDSPSTCSHYFVDALSWMRPELEQGKIDGRLECPRCKTNVGKYAWQGMNCSCGDWVVPGISLTKSRVDAAKSRLVGHTADSNIRLPIDAKMGRGLRQGNL